MSNLRKEARGRHCQVRLAGICNHNPATVVLAHVRLAGVTGTGLKAKDLLSSLACSACHLHCDSHSDDASKRAFYEGVIRTQNIWISEGKVRW